MSTKTHKRLCKAKSARTGKPCKKAPINGGTVCDRHGGRAPQVKKAAENRLKQYVQEMVDPDRVLAETARIAMSDPTALFDEQGNVKPMKEWTEEARAAVAGIETVQKNIADGDGHTDHIHKVKVWDKPKALEMLAKHLGLLVEKVDHGGAVTFRWEDE